MTDEDTTHDNEPPEGGLPTDHRPLGHLLRIVDGLIAREFAAAFEAEGVTRRDWMLLNALSGTVDVPGFADALARRGKRLRSLVERGWVTETDGRWELTDDGRAARARLDGLVQGIRAKVAAAVSPEDFATTTASLEAIAGELGGDEGDWMPRGHRGFGTRHGFGPRRGFGPGFGPFGHGPFAHGLPHGHRLEHGGLRGHTPCDEHQAHAEHRAGRQHGEYGHAHRRDDRGRKAERAYERGFAAGFRAAGRPGDIPVA